ncbi:hypothetical protein P885DRAFT_71011 [Corynascus similis CBS 632.67]
MPTLWKDVRPRFAPQPGPLPQFWCPSPDPEKPACPYRPGFAVEIKRHTPPPPFGDPHYGPGTGRERSDVDLHKVTQTRVVMEYPPLENLLASSALAVEDSRGPQLLVCSVAPHVSPGQGGPPAPYQTVVKIFGPLYYSFANPEAIHEPFPVAWQADIHYTREAAAFEHLIKRAQTGGGAGLLAPKYFGSIRTVCLTQSATASYTEQNRLDIFAAVLDGVVRQRHAGVDQRDLAARNPKQPLPQPVIVDYNRAVVFELSRFVKHRSQFAALPQNPIELF